MENFKNTEIYKKALKEYQDKLYKDILNPLHSIIENNDEVNLFYNQDNIQDICSKMKEIFEIQHEGEVESCFSESL